MKMRSAFCLPRSAPGARLSAAVLGIALAAGTAEAQSARSAAILLLKDNDTVVVDRLLRTDSTVTAVVAGRVTPRFTVAYRLDAAGNASAATFSVQGPGTPPDAPALQSGTVAIVGDSAALVVRQGASERRLMLPTKRGAMIIVNNDFTVLEQMARRARREGVTRLTVPLFALSGGVTIEGTFEATSVDSARFTIGQSVTQVSLDAAGNVTGGSVPAAGVRILVVTGPDAARVAIGAPDYSAPADAPYAAENVVVHTPAGHDLAGTLTMPKGTSGRVPAVVTITGSGMQDRDEAIPIVNGYRPFRQVADTLSRRGIAVLRMDDRGVGGSGGDVNGTSADFANDIRAGVAYLRQRRDIDADRIALVGHSEGGLIAPIVAATDPRLAAIVLMAGPSWTGRRVIDYQLERGVLDDTTVAPSKRDSALKALHAQLDSGAARGPWMRYFLDYDPVPTLRRVKQPVLILQGATDRQVAAEQADEIERALHRAGNRNVTKRVFPARNHLFLADTSGSPSGYSRLPNGRVDAEVMGTLADWLARALRAR